MAMTGERLHPSRSPAGSRTPQPPIHNNNNINRNNKSNSNSNSHSNSNSNSDGNTRSFLQRLCSKPRQE